MTASAASRLDALRRPTGDRMVGGVAAAVARAVDIDPVIVRIGFVVLTFVGFAGPLLYVAGWLLVPTEGRDRSPLGDALNLESDSQLRTVGLIVAAAIALAAVLGDSAWGPGPWFWGPLWVLAWVAAVGSVLYWLLVARPREARQVVVPPPPYEPAQFPDSPAFAAADPAPAAAPTADTAADPMSVTAAAPAPARTEPLVAPAPRRPRWSPALLLMTLSAIVAAMGALALWAVVEEPLPAAVYPAVALAVVVVGLLVGTRFGHPGALIPLGLLLLPVLLVASVAPRLTAGTVDLEPTSAAQIAAPIDQGFGSVRVDLTGLDPAELTGRTLQIGNGFGRTRVVVPAGLDVEVRAGLDLGGRVTVFGKVDDGNRPRVRYPADAPGAYRIEITGSAGEIEVVRS